MINDIYVYGDSLQHFLIAIIWIEQDNLKKLGQQWNINDGNLAESEALKNALKNEFQKIVKSQKLNSLEKIQDMYIDTNSWMDLDLITTSFKKKRFELKRYYQGEIDRMYKKSQ